MKGPGVVALGLPRFVQVKTKRHKAITLDDKIAFFNQTSTLLNAGTALLRALEVVGEQSESEKARQLIAKLTAQVASGSALADAMERHPRFFEEHWVELVRAGEATGRLAETLVSLTAYIEKRKAIQGKIVSSLMYPAVMVTVLVAALFVMFWKVVPTFAAMLKDFGSELPAITVYVIDISNFVQANGLYMLGGAIAAGFGWTRYTRTAGGRRVRDLGLMLMPLSASFVVETSMERFAANLSLLLRSGTPLLEGLAVVQRMFRNQAVYYPALAAISSHVEKGSTLAEALERTGLFTSMVINMVRVGEESGKLPQVLEEIALFYKLRVEIILSRLTGLVEPVIVIVMGISVGVIMMSLYLPMFQMSSGPR